MKLAAGDSINVIVATCCKARRRMGPQALMNHAPYYTRAVALSRHARGAIPEWREGGSLITSASAHAGVQMA